MTIFSFELALVLLSYGAHWVLVTRHQGFWNLDSLFILFQTILAAGTLTIPLDPINQADRLYGAVVTLPVVIYAFFSIVLFTHFHHNHPNLREKLSRRTIIAVTPTRAVRFLLLLSIAIVLLYFFAVGYNVFLLAIRNSFSGKTADYQTLRIDSYSGSKYLFPGYVNQFKNCILPALSIIVIYWLYATKRTGRLLITVPLAVLSLVGVLGTGQRGAFVLVVFTLLAFMFHVNPQRFRVRAVAVIGTALPLFILATYINGRSQQQLQHNGSAFGKFGVLWGELWKRAFYDNQWSGQIAFRYTYSKGIVHGSDWGQSLLSAFPKIGPIAKSTGPNLAQQVFAYLYGTDRGTAPPSIWGSVYYNWGMVGVVILPVLLAVIFRKLTNCTVTAEQMSALEVVGMAGFTVVVGNWIAGGPEYLLNAGAIAFAFLWWLGRRLTARAPQVRIIDEPVGSEPLARISRRRRWPGQRNPAAVLDRNHSLRITRNNIVP